MADKGEMKAGHARSGVVFQEDKDYPPKWDECEDIRILDDNKNVIFSGPRYMRCRVIECGSLVTHGQIQHGGSCKCGGRRLSPAMLLTEKEKIALKAGEYLLTEWETESIYGNQA